MSITTSLQRCMISAPEGSQKVQSSMMKPDTQLSLGECEESFVDLAATPPGARGTGQGTKGKGQETTARGKGQGAECKGYTAEFSRTACARSTLLGANAPELPTTPGSWRTQTETSRVARSKPSPPVLAATLSGTALLQRPLSTWGFALTQHHNGDNIESVLHKHGGVSAAPHQEQQV